MQSKKIKEVLEKQISLTKLNEEELRNIKEEASKFVSLLKKAVKAGIFIGGSLAKGTIVKKSVQDIDIFVRFRNEGETQKLGKLKILGYKRKLIHGSRDYLQFKKGKIIFEVVPVLKINKPEQAKNVTDLSYFHVNYIVKAINKNKKLADEIKLAKAFCFANECYGAESFIQGFSGYSLELLVNYYGGFEKWLGAMVKVKDKLVIDPGKKYKNKQEVLNNLNEAKLSSPVIFVDPTFKQRNALAALSFGTFLRFQKQARAFLNKPSLAFFKKTEINEKDYNFILKASTNKQAGDIAGTKLLKYFKYLKAELEKKFELGKAAFHYDDKKKADYYFNIKSKPIIISGPPIAMNIAVANFKKAHKKTFVKAGKVCAKEKAISTREFLRKLDKKIMHEMGIVNLSS